MPVSEAASPVLPWRVKLFCSFMGFFSDVSVRKDGTVNRGLMRILDIKSPANEQPVKGVSTVDYTVDPKTGVWFRLFAPAGISDGEKLPVVIFFHGGGFTFLEADSRAYDLVCRRFARRLRAFVVSVNYRLAPEHRFPAAYEDAEATIRWISEPGRLPDSADLGRCFVAGDSAGANIVHHVGCRIAAAPSDFLPVKIKGHVLIQPFFGGQERTPSENRLKEAPIARLARLDFCWNSYLPKGSDRDHPAANVTGPKAPDLSGLGLPPSLIVVGGFDPLQDHDRLYYARLVESGVKTKLIEYPKAIHAFYVFLEIPESGELLAEIKAFVEEEHGA